MQLNLKFNNWIMSRSQDTNFLMKKEAQKPKRIVIRIWNKCTNRFEICLSKMKISKVRISFILLILILIFFGFALKMFSTLIVWFFHDFLLIFLLFFQVSQLLYVYLVHVIEQPNFRIPNPQYLQPNFCFDFFNDSENTFWGFFEI